MTINAVTFLVLYPEFAPLESEDNSLITAVLGYCDRRTAPGYDPTTREDIVFLRAAHQLALSPAGRNADLSADGKTRYKEDLDARLRANACGIARVV